MEKKLSSNSIKRIAITGPESTGKSELAQNLSAFYNTTWVPEHARDYIENLNHPYNQNDLLKIAKGQCALEEKKMKQANQILFCDTELIVIKIWSEHAFKECDPWILREIERMPYDLYLLCNIDIPWKNDPQREHPNLREYFFNLYKKELEARKLPFKIISGIGKQRLENAIKEVNDYLPLP